MKTTRTKMCWLCVTFICSLIHFRLQFLTTLLQYNSFCHAAVGSVAVQCHRLILFQETTSLWNIISCFVFISEVIMCSLSCSYQNATNNLWRTDLTICILGKADDLQAFLCVYVWATSSASRLFVNINCSSNDSPTSISLPPVKCLL